MITDLQIKVGIAVGAILLTWYAYYNIVVVPQNTIDELTTTVEEQKKVPTKIVNKINKADANRTQKAIYEEEYDENITIRDSGVLFF